MIFKSPLISEGSGSLAGITISHNRGGMYLRRRAVPTNPNSVYQQAVRGFVNALSNHWINTLTEVQREAWTTYANNVPMPNPLGDPITLTGLNHYIRSNVPRLQSGLARVDAGPTVFNLGEFTNPTFGYDVAAEETDVFFLSADAWASETGSGMLVFGSRQQNNTINYFKGPYRVMSAIPGADGSPPSSPAALDAPFPCAAGNKSFDLVRVTRLDGRLSMPFRGFGVGA